jgi:hypothetical protein
MHAYGFLYLFPLACFFEGKELWLLIYRVYNNIDSSNINEININGNGIDHHNSIYFNNISTSLDYTSVPNQQLLEVLRSSSSLQDDNNNNELIVLLRLFIINSIAFTLYNLSGAFVLQYSNLMIHSVINTFRYSIAYYLQYIIVYFDYYYCFS